MMKQKQKESKYSKPSRMPPGSGEGQKWTSLVHSGVIFPPEYKPHGVKMLYNGKHVNLTYEQEEVATVFAVMLNTDYMGKTQFKENFWCDWQKIFGKNHTIKNLDNCDFKPYIYYNMMMGRIRRTNFGGLKAGNKEEIEKFSKRTVKVTRQHNEDCKKLLRLMGVPVIEAQSEAEAQCVALCKADKVYAVASEDMDSLTFGAPKFLRHVMDPASRKIPVMEFDVSKVLEELNLTMDQFIDLCILCGCDYCDSIRGIGGMTALKLIRQHGSIESILENINKERYQIPEDWPYQEARRLFKEPLVCVDDETLELKWSAPDEEGLLNFLVTENGFNTDRVTKAVEKIKASKNKSSQNRLESFFKPVVSTSVPIKRKETNEKGAKESANKKAQGGGGRKRK